MSAIKQSSNESRSLDELARLPQALIMRMVQSREIKEEDLAPILSRKAQIADDMAKAKALEEGKDQMDHTVLDEIMAKNAMAENPMPQQIQQMPPQINPSMMAQQMPQAPEEAGVGQLPIPARTYAGGGIVAFDDGGEVDDVAYNMAREDADMNIGDSIQDIYKMARSKMSGIPSKLSEIASQLPKSYEATKTQIFNNPSNGKDPFLAKIEHLESRGKEYDKQGNILTSPKGAKGSMQVMDKTNLNPGFGVKPAQDNSLEERARVGRDYALALKNYFNGDEKLASMAYNWGPGNVKKWLASHGAIPVPHETRKYASNFAQGGYVPGYSGLDGISYVDLYGNKVNIPMDADEETAPKTTKTEPKYKETPRKTIDELLKPVKPTGPQNPYGQKTAGIGSLTPRAGGDEYTNVYPAGGAGADASYLNQLMMQSQKDPSYQPYKDEIAVLLKKNPNLAGIVANQNKMTSQPTKAEVKPTPSGNAPSVDKNALVDQYLNNYLTNQKTQGQPSAQQKAENDIFAQMIARNEEERNRIRQSAQEDKNLALLASGLGIMGGTSPYAFANIGQGALKGVEYLGSSKARRASEMNALSASDLKALYYGQENKRKERALAEGMADRNLDNLSAYDAKFRKNFFIEGVAPTPKQVEAYEAAKRSDALYQLLLKNAGVGTPTNQQPVLNYNQKSRSVG